MGDRGCEPYASRPLDETPNSIRLVTIEPTLKDGLLSCSLSTVTFGQRPNYETLSYRWGDESNKTQIIVNGVKFQVTANLSDALHYFRRNARTTPIWIDAISINQEDISERNSQLRIMPHIYSRASATLVWLGAAYAEMPLNLGPGRELEPDHDARDKIVANGYWNRVWILQEIGKARNINLCVGEAPVDWKRFISWISMHDGDGDVQSEGDDVIEGPLKLDRLRKHKYDGSCTLRQLLINHAGALSTEPRDKIYGLVGLASDGRGFPLDYNKPLLEVWCDTIRFMSRYNLLPEECEERVSFCRLVRDLLGGDKIGSVSGVVQLSNGHHNQSFCNVVDRTCNDDMANSALTFTTDVLGVIKSLGPSASELISSPTLADELEVELQRLYSREELDQGHLEHDSLMHLVLDSPTGKVTDLSKFEIHRMDFHGPELFRDYWDFMHPDKRMPPSLVGAWAYDTTTMNEPRLVLLKSSSADWQDTGYKMAFVSCVARQGDVVCRIADHPMKRIVVRTEPDPNSNQLRMHVCSTAVMVKDVLKEDSAWDQVELNYPTKMDVMMDASTLYALIFGDDGQEAELTRQLEGL